MAQSERLPLCSHGETLYVLLGSSGLLSISTTGDFPVAYFSDDPLREYPYVTVEYAIEWHATMIDLTEGEFGNIRMKALLGQALDKFKAGKVRYAS